MKAGNLMVCGTCNASKWFQYLTDLRALGWTVRWRRRRFLWWRWWAATGPLCPDCAEKYPNPPDAPTMAGASRPACFACRIEADIGTEEQPHPVPAKYHTCNPVRPT